MVEGLKLKNHQKQRIKNDLKSRLIPASKNLKELGLMIEKIQIGYFKEEIKMEMKLKL
jgi:hypothetical protein